MGRPKGSKNVSGKNEVKDEKGLNKNYCPKRPGCKMFIWYCKKCARWEECKENGKNN